MKIYNFKLKKQTVSVLAKNKKNAIALAQKSVSTITNATPCVFESVQLPQF